MTSEYQKQRNNESKKRYYLRNRERELQRRREYNKVYYAQNREREKQRRRDYTAANKEKIAAYDKLWREQHPNYAAEWRARNPEINRLSSAKWLSKNPGYTAEWAKKNPEKVREYQRRNSKRRAGQASHPYTKLPKIAERFAFFGDRCAYCETGEAESVDHVIALSNGGLHLPANLRPACMFCNRSKKNRDWRLFPARI